MNFEKEKHHFKGDETGLDKEKYVIETFLFESQIDPEDAALHLCQEHSTAQWKRVDVDEDFRPQHAAKLLSLEVLETKDTPAFPAPFHTGPKFHTCRARIANPHINFGAKLPNLLTVVCGEGVFYSPGITAIKLLDLDFPDAYLDQFEGPQFGVRGVRDLLQIYDRPIFLGVVKPNIGLDPGSFSELAYQSWLGGLDAPKDDEMLADVGYSTLEKRTALLGKLRRKAEQETGEKKMYIANITDEVDRIEALHDMAVANGINAVMLNGWAIGLSACRSLRKKAKVPLVAHFDFIAAFTRVPYFGMSVALSTKLQRLAGFDIILFPGLSARMQTTKEEMMSNVKACLEPMGKIKPSLPVPGGSDWAGNLDKMYDIMGSVDFGMVPGRGVFNHPMGPKAGARSFRQAWEAIQKKIPVKEYANSHEELKTAFEAFEEC
ncbi:MAG: RuBisCO large subunit C-terminal-like domain-containing protein [Deltaproteobacteria bacterium]|nr:RuBisCO large subunit C-terminal-like domain-containing protein [Deltaproteobacteria bacterium]